MDKYTIDSSIYLNLNPYKWAAESFEIASTKVYNGK
jgi:hypothetical protein